MRLSRKAGLLACGIRWLKYACEHTEVANGEYEYGQNYEWELTASGEDENYYVQGYSDYSVAWNESSNQYEYVAAGDQSDASPDNPGTVYEIGTTTVTRYTVSSDGSYTVHTRRVETWPSTDDVYTVGAQIGSVRAKKGEYPDAKNGYTYVDTTDDGYTIMKDGNGVYYAYIPAAGGGSTDDGSGDNTSGGGSGDSSDTTDVYDVTFEDGVLYIKSAPATLNGNTLEVT